VSDFEVISVKSCKEQELHLVVLKNLRRHFGASLSCCTSVLGSGCEVCGMHIQVDMVVENLLLQI
jgi:hypothetical protein